MIRITQKLSSTLLRSDAHSAGLIPNPRAILDTRNEYHKSKTQTTHSRFHNYETELLHLLNPCLILLSERWDVWPLISPPQRLRLVRVVDRTIEIYPLVVVCFTTRDVLLQPGITWAAVEQPEYARQSHEYMTYSPRA